MTRGKTICSVLKTIRKQVANANEIKYEPRECHHQGECRGTCPACEAEVRYIERELDIRQQLGKAVAVVGISAGLSALSGCGDKASNVDSVSEKESRLTVGKAMIEPPKTVDGDVEFRSPVDTVIIDKDPATVKKRTAPFKAPVPVRGQGQHVVVLESEEVDSVVCDEEGVYRTGEVVVEPKKPLTEENTEIFGDVAEQMPSFPGGQKKLMEFLAENTRYPKECEEACVQGRVVVTFLVERDGSISHIKVARSVDPLLDEEAVRVVSSMPKWIPGMQNGVRVGVRYTIPVTFRLP